MFLGVLVMLPALSFVWIPRPAEEQRLPLHHLRSTFRSFSAELRHLLRQQRVLFTLALFVLPTGSFALTNQLSGVASGFGATEQFVARMGGAALSGAGAAACLLVPVLSRRVRPLKLYLGIGITGCVFTLGLLFLPRTPPVFALGFLGENVFQAMSFTAAVAIVLELIGRGNPLAGTLFGLLTSATVLPILVMGVLDGRAAARQGTNGMLAVDGLVGLAACLGMAGGMWLRERKQKRLESRLPSRL